MSGSATGPPSISPRVASITDVTGLTFTNACSHPGIVSTGANLYHDTHFGIGLEMHRGRPHLDDTVLREAGVVRIYDILFDYEVLLQTDAFFRRHSFSM